MADRMKWCSVGPETGAQEKDGVVERPVAPFCGDSISETCADRGWMVKLRFSEYGLSTGKLVLTFQ